MSKLWCKYYKSENWYANEFFYGGRANSRSNRAVLIEEWDRNVKDKKTDIEESISKNIDQISKILEISPEDVYRLPIPFVQSQVNARVSNLVASRYKAEKNNEIDLYSKEDYYGMKALTTVVNSLFGGGNNDNEKHHGARNIRDRR